MLGSLLLLFGLGLAAVVAIGLMLAVLGLVFGTAAFLLFKVAPVLLVGWIVLKLVGRSRRPDRIAASDRKWLDGE